MVEFVINEKFETKDTTECLFLVTKTRKSLTHNEIITELLGQLKFKAMYGLRDLIMSTLSTSPEKKKRMKKSSLRQIAVRINEMVKNGQNRAFD
ncbi:12301_t:CDS:2, partial [Entrophospora sp. SA101]